MKNINHSHTRDLLLADLKHFGESLWRNDDIGERRFNFFLTLVTAIVAGLVTLYAAKEGTIEKDVLANITRGALFGLFLLGVLTYLRLLHRNRVTREYHRTLAYIRNKLVETDPICGPYDVPQRIRGSVKWLRAGLAETVGVLTAIVLFALLVREHISLLLAGALSTSFALGLVLAAAYRKDYSTAVQGSASTISSAPDVSNTPAQYFRAGVGAVIFNDQGQVLVLERSDVPGAWQLPQGGIEDSEEPRQAIYREVFEETHISGSRLEIVDCYPELVAYELPAAVRSQKTGRGQVQYWYLLKLEGSNDEGLKVGTEFTSWRWMPSEKVIDVAVDFRKRIYQKLFDQFQPYLSPPQIHQ